MDVSCGLEADLHAVCRDFNSAALPLAAKSKTGLISPQHSLAVLVQFRDLSIAKSQNRTYVGENQLLRLPA